MTDRRWKQHHIHPLRQFLTDFHITKERKKLFCFNRIRTNAQAASPSKYKFWNRDWTYPDFDALFKVLSRFFFVPSISRSISFANFSCVVKCCFCSRSFSWNIQDFSWNPSLEENAGLWFQNMAFSYTVLVIHRREGRKPKSREVEAVSSGYSTGVKKLRGLPARLFTFDRSSLVQCVLNQPPPSTDHQWDGQCCSAYTEPW